MSNNVLDVKELISKLGLDKVLCKAFAKSTGKSEEEYLAMFNNIVDKELNNIGKAFSSENFDETKLSRLQGLSLEDFMKDNDKIIKDK